jgi:hypothetical protein
MTTKLMLAMATALVASTAAWAETAVTEIPFQFSVGKTILPAGKYTVDTEIGQRVLRVRSKDWQHAIMILVTPTQNSPATGRGKAVFNCYNGNCFLSKVVYPGGAGQELSPTAREREMVAQLKQRKEALLASK